MRFHRRRVLADLNRPRVGLSEGDVSLDRHKCLRGRTLVMASGATGFSHSKPSGPSFDEVVERKMAALKFIEIPKEGSTDA